ncbi:hypothetical protein EV294_1165 [Paenibacillus sp. BK033]|uniref:imm11 family protein n=1 Tax=Paenibacillus sp. BK033 TaxID=2512133 RepID=UPI00104CF399|nr:DUF1629 domain-containing protein [Paenibacillus sp. BK033]TCM87925.1 hypothetical protein EV294_1165 [Paenibacillus sp. BK033]
MKIWEMNSDHDSYVLADNPEADDLIRSIKNDEHPLKDWNGIYLNLLRKGKEKDYIGYLPGATIISEYAKQALTAQIGDEAEFLFILDRPIHFLHVLKRIDCIDIDRTERTESGLIKSSERVHFIREKIPVDTLIFKVPEIRTSVYVTEKFINLVKQANLTGFVFNQVWDSKLTEEKDREKHLKYTAVLADIEQNKGDEIAYRIAREQVNQGLAFASGKWKMQLDSKGNFWLGDLTEDCVYSWIMPTFIPPVLLGYQWHVVENSEIKIK